MGQGQSGEVVLMGSALLESLAGQRLWPDMVAVPGGSVAPLQ